MEVARDRGRSASDVVKITNREGRSPFVLVCDHASNFLPPVHGTLGLDPSDLTRHIAWDPGALPVARRLAGALDAVLIEACVSRLVVDCNRSLDAPDLIPTLSEKTPIPGNEHLSPDQREQRIASTWRPFHAAIEDVVAERQACRADTRLMSIHSFTPSYKGVVRPWQIGILHDDDTRLAAPMIEALRDVPGLTVGDNQPYAPGDGVYYTLDRHGRSRGLACVMVEIRNDEIADDAGQRRWADLIAGIVGGAATINALRAGISNA